MALIKCSGCGHMVSDKGTKCPKCGTPIHKVEEATKPIEEKEKVIAEVETPKAEIAKAEAVVPDEPKSQTWKKVCGIFIFAVIVIVGVYYYIQNEKSNSKSEEEIAQLNSEAFLEDGEYCYKGKWESAQHAAQPCKVEFIIKNGALIDCAYTNLKFNVRIPLKGTIEDNNLHFVSENDGKLIIELKLSDNGMMLIGEGTDYAHSGDNARLNLSKIELDAVYNEQMNEEQELFECQTDQIREEYNSESQEEVDYIEEFEGSDESYGTDDSKFANVSFQKIGDIFNFIRPSKKFLSAKGEIEITCETTSQGEHMMMYYKGHLLSEVGWSNPKTVPNDRFAEMAIRTESRQIPIILHLPDGSHKQPYLYFKPIKVETDRNLAKVMNLPIEESWEEYEPTLDGNKATMVFRVSDDEPYPTKYKMKE